MARRTRRPTAPAIKSDLTPMIDVTFLIVSMRTIQFRTLDARSTRACPERAG